MENYCLKMLNQYIIWINYIVDNDPTKAREQHVIRRKKGVLIKSKTSREENKSNKHNVHINKDHTKYNNVKVTCTTYVYSRQKQRDELLFISYILCKMLNPFPELIWSRFGIEGRRCATIEPDHGSKVMLSASFLTESKSTEERYLSPKLGKITCNKEFMCNQYQ